MGRSRGLGLSLELRACSRSFSGVPRTPWQIPGNESFVSSGCGFARLLTLRLSTWTRGLSSTCMNPGGASWEAGLVLNIPGCWPQRSVFPGSMCSLWS